MKAIYISKTLHDRQHSFFTPIKDKKKVLFELLEYVGYKEVFICELPFNEKDPNLLLDMTQENWKKHPIEEILNQQDFVFNLENLFDLGFPISTKAKARAFCSLDSRFITKLSTKLLKDRNFILEILNDDTLALKNEVNIHAGNNYIFHYLEDVLSHFDNDKEIVLKCIDTDAANYVFASFDLKNDIEIVKESVKKDSDMFQYIPSKYKDDFDITVSSWIQDEKLTLEHMSHRLKLMWFWGKTIECKE
jgi:hypothetical protein